MSASTAVSTLALVLAAASLVAAFSRGEPPADAPTAVLRAQRLELVDDRGVLRARLHTEPGGEVVLRLMDQPGEIRVKLGASQCGSGLLLANHAAEPGVHLLAEAAGSRIRIAHGGSERVIEP